MQSVDEFTPSTTELVFGSGLISQTKSQSSTNNDITGNENAVPPSEPIVNGQNDTTANKITSNESITNGTTETISENTGAGDSAGVHVNGENEKPPVETNNEVKPVEESTATEKPNQIEPIIPSTVPEPISSTPVDTVNEGSSTVDTAPLPPPAVEPTTTAVNDNVPEVPVATESEPAQVKSKSPRGKAKAPVVSTAPTRQSTRGRKPASSSNVEENQTTDDTDATATTNRTESSQRTKRQAATIAKDAITASNQINSASDGSITDDVNDQDVIPSDGDEDDHIIEGQTKNVSPSGGKKRGAPKSTPNTPKKAKGKNSITLINDVDNGTDANEGETIPTPPKKARTSANKKTPEPPSEEYVRKLRPRK
jgi:hypothetical protein